MGMLLFITILAIGIFQANGMLDVELKINGGKYVCEEAVGNGPIPKLCAAPTLPCDILATEKEREARDVLNFKLPSYIYCENVKALLGCFLDTSIPICGEFVEGLVEGGEAISKRLQVLEDNCLCKNTERFNYLCNDPCSAKPCLNGGKCKTSYSKISRRDSRRNYYYYRNAIFEFEGCECQRPFTGEFCQKCESCEETCKSFNTCNCPKNKGGPYCNLECEAILHDPALLLRPCIQFASDINFETAYSSTCEQVLLLAECVAATAHHCRFDVIPYLTDLGLWPTLRDLGGEGGLLEIGGCPTLGKLPFDLSLLETPPDHK